MSKDIEVSTRVKGEVSVIDIKGDVTALTGQPIEDAYKEVSNTGAKKILLCFDKKAYINSGGIAILIGLVSESRKKEYRITSKRSLVWWALRNIHRSFRLKRQPLKNSNSKR